MGKNYYNSISDVLTDGFDLLYKEWAKENPNAPREAKRLAKKIVSNAKATADESFRTQYKQTRLLLSNELGV